MKTEDDNLNEHAPAGSPKIHPTRADLRLAAPKENPYPAWKQARCIWCKAGELYTGGAWFGIRHRLNAGPSNFQYVDCTAPSAEDYIAELEQERDDARTALAAIHTALDAVDKKLNEMNNAVAADIATLCDRLPRAEADSAMLDFLEKQTGFEVYRVLQSECTGYMRVLAITNQSEAEGKTLREATRAAMKRPPQESGTTSSSSTEQDCSKKEE